MTAMPETASTRTPRFWVLCVAIGLFAGFLSGLFGIGGGTVVVPLLVLLLMLPQKLSSGTSLAAIIPTAAVGVISYAATGSVHWGAALLLAAGAIVGAQIGTWLLPKLPALALRWGFVGFLVIVIVSLFVSVPSREGALEVGWISGAALVGAGVITGILSGILGVGGGIIVVPLLMVMFGASDLVAKGTSLMMMIPAALSGTVGNLMRGNVDVRAAATIGLAACATTAMGAWLATVIDPLTGTVLFAVFLAVLAVQMLVKIRRQKA